MADAKTKGQETPTTEAGKGGEPTAKEADAIPKDALPAHLRDKSPDELKAYFSEDQKRREDFMRLQNTVERLENQVASAGSRPQSGDGSGDDDGPTDDDYFSKPSDAVRKQAERVVDEKGAPLQQEQLRQAEDIALMRMSQKYTDWQEFEEDAKEFIKDQHGGRKLGQFNERDLDLAYWKLKGPKLESKSKNKDSSVRSEKPSKPEPLEKKSDELTPEEKESARRWNISEDEWKETKDKMAGGVMTVTPHGASEE